MFAHDFGHLCRGTRIQTSEHSDLGIFNNFGASSIFTWACAVTASAACPSQPGNLAITSIIFAAVIWDAPESFFTLSHRSTALPLCFCNVGSNSAFFEVTNVHQCGKVDFLYVPLCFQNNLLFAIDFFQMPCGNCLELFLFLVHCGFCIRNFHRSWHRDELVSQTVMGHRSKSFTCNVIFMGFWTAKIPLVASWIQENCFGLFLGCTVQHCSHFRDALLSFYTAWLAP